MHVLIYVRVSTDKQADKELSLPAQLHACRQYATQRGWQIVEEFIEPGASARTAERPQLKRLLNRCRNSDVPIHAVIIHKLDRLARNLADHVAIRGVLSKNGVKLASVTENLDDSVSGQLVEHIMASIAEFYSANLGEEVKKGMRQKVRQGGWPHLPPRGYMVIRDPMGRSRIEIDPRIGPIVRRAFEIAALGIDRPGALRSTLIRLGLTKRDGGPLEKNAARKLLRNPFYCGRLLWEGQMFQGNHPVLVAPEQFDRVQELLGKRPYECHGSRFLLAGFARCSSCAERMSAEHHGRWSYYRCRNNLKSSNRCRARFSNMATTHIVLRRLYERMPVPPGFLVLINSRLREVATEQLNILEASRERIRHRLAVLDTHTIRLADALAEGTMDVEVHRLASTRIVEEAEILKRQLARMVPASEQFRIDQATSLWEVHRALSLVQQQALLPLVFEDLVLSPVGISGYRFTATFSGVQLPEASPALLAA